MKIIGIIRIILAILVLIASMFYVWKGNILLPGIAIFITVSFGLLALSMNYKEENNKERNAWDVWFFSMPGAIVALIFIGILADNTDIWKWIVIVLGGIIGLESLSSIIKNQLEI